MNKIYRNIRNAATGAIVAAAETAKTHSKSVSGQSISGSAHAACISGSRSAKFRLLVLSLAAVVPLLLAGAVQAQSTVCTTTGTTYNYANNKASQVNGVNWTLGSTKGVKDNCTVNVDGTSSLTITNSTISNDKTGNQGQVVHGQGNSTITIQNSTLTSSPGNIGLGVDGSGKNSNPTATISGSTINQNSGGQALHARSGTIYSSGNVINLSNAIGIRSFNDTTAGSGVGEVTSTGDRFNLSGGHGTHGTDASRNDGTDGALALKAHGGGAIHVTNAKIGGPNDETPGAGDGMYATGSGSLIDGSGNTINLDNRATGGGGYALSASDQGLIALTNTIINTQGDGTVGARSDSKGTVALDGGSIATQGASAHALYSTGSGSTTSASAMNVDTSGDKAIGAYATNGGTVNLADTTLTTAGAGAHGAQADSSSKVTVAGGSIATTGANAYGVYANGSQATVDLSQPGGATVSTTQDGSHGVVVASGGTAKLAGNAISTEGQGAHGIVVDGPTSSVGFGAGTSIATQGDGSHAVRVQNGASTTFNAAAGQTLPNAQVSGEGSAVVNASGANSTLTLAGNTALATDMTQGQGSLGALAEQGGTVRVQDSATTGGTAVKADAGKLQFQGEADASGSRVSLVNGGTLDVTNMQAGTPLNTGSLDGDSTAAVHLGANTLVSGVDNAAGNGALLADSTYNGTIDGTGSLNVAANKLTLTGHNTGYSGETVIDAGNAHLVITNNEATGTGAVRNDGTLELQFSANNPEQYDVSYTNNVSGEGVTIVSGKGIDVSGDNSAFAGAWQVGQDASMQVKQEKNVGTAAVDLQGTLNVAPATGGFTLDNKLTGDGELIVVTGAREAEFSFGDRTGDGFTGTLEMGRGTLNLAGQNTTALTNATLSANTDSTIVVGSGEQRIGALRFNDGTVVFGATLPDQSVADGTISVTTLDASGAGQVVVTVPEPYNAVTPTVDTRVSLLEQDDGEISVQLVKADNVVGSGGSLALVDQNGRTLSPITEVEIAQNGATVAIGEYGYRTTTAPGDGLYANYGLTQVDLQDSQTLTLQPRDGATGAATDLSAKVTGVGNLAIDAGGNKVSLSNTNNDYTGATSVHSGTLQMAADNALGQTRALNLDSGTTAQMAGYSQTIGQLQAAEGSTLDLQGGALDISYGGTADGTVQGGGRLNVNGGTLGVSGANTGLSAETAIAEGATVRMNDTAGLGSGAIDDKGALVVDGASGSLANAVSGTGEVNLANNANVAATGNNSGFSGQFGIDNGSALSVSQAQNLGTANVANEGTLRVANDSDWVLANAVEGSGSLVKDGAGTLGAGDALTYTGTTAVNAGTLVVGDATTPSRTLGGAGAGEVTVAPGATLAGSGTVSGHVTNTGTVAALNTLPAYAAAQPGSFTLANGLTNAGTVNLAGPAGSTPGNTLVVNGDYVGNNGSLVIRTYMGDDSSPTDKLVISEGNGSGSTSVIVKSAGGSGAATTEGIRVVETQNGATTEIDAFALDPSSDGYRQGRGTLAAGAYDYSLARGGNNGVADDWYLVAASEQPQEQPQPVIDAEAEANNPATPATPAAPAAVTPKYRPEVGAYMNNKLFATTMSMHTLRDRQGQEPDTEAVAEGRPGDRSAWGRVAGSTTSRDGAGGLHSKDNSVLVHVGSDVYRFSDGGDGSVRIGLMGAYGHSNNTSNNGDIGARGTVNGYNAGLYGTWYGHRDILTGPYVDTWLTYGHYANTVKGDGLAAESYGSQTISGSVEGGYAFQLYDNGRNRLFVIPQAQVILQRYSAGSHTEYTGTTVSGQSQTGATTRLGVRFHGDLKGESGHAQTRPFVEVNWLHGPSSQTILFNGVAVNEGLPANRVEGKVGVQGKVGKRTNVFGHVGVEAGSQGYTAGKAQVGVKHSW
jgi:outer membrane autotransporter protein